jgi:CRP/FNR family cyclic AMP-dependent transcriptional regulator
VTESPEPDDLARLDRFADLSADELALLVSKGTRLHIPTNWSVIWERTPADKAYIILDGEVSVRKGGQEIARLGPGDTVGEAAIIAHKLRSASVVSVTELEVLHYTSEAVQELLDSVPSFRAAMEQTTRERLGTPEA